MAELLYLTYELARGKDKATNAFGTMLSDPASADCVCALLKCAIVEDDYEQEMIVKSWSNEQTIARAEELLSPNEWGFNLTGTEDSYKHFPPFEIVYEFVCDKGDGIQAQTLAIQRHVVAEWWASHRANAI